MTAARVAPDGLVQIAIVSHHDDLHAHAVKKAVEADGNIECHVIGCDSLSHFGRLSWDSDRPEQAAVLPAVHGGNVDVRDLEVVWFRRCFAPQVLLDHVTETSHRELISEHSSNALLGVLLSSFRGRWISEPTATRGAENKLVQLRAARRAGMTVPRTLDSNDPESIREFCEALFAQQISAGHLVSDECLRMCPAIYQEYVPGDQHVRVHIFGEEVLAVLMETADLDWRITLDVHCRAVELDGSTEAGLRRVLRLLNLRMGIFDLKLNGTVPTFLEVNPQGQYLFVEALSGLPLTGAMAGFLRREAVDGTG